MEALLHNACINFGAASFTVVFIILDMLRISIFQLRCVLVEWVSSSCLVKFVAAHWLIIAPPILWAICLSREFSLVRSVGDCESRLNIVWLGRNIWKQTRDPKDERDEILASHLRWCFMLLQAIPGMVLSLVLCYDHRRGRDPDNEGTFMKGIKYIHFGGCGFFVGVTAALVVGALWQAAQPALLFLVNYLLHNCLTSISQFRVHHIYGCRRSCTAQHRLSNKDIIFSIHLERIILSLGLQWW